ncbi:MAG TPA: extracellular solute-binding protein [Roseiflexaceae bacterium]|nr:extracellular solute-binding protein [Roseiflexaceae bacterium]
MEDTTPRLSRRAMLRAMLGSAGMALLAACGGTPTAPPAAPAEAPAAEPTTAPAAPAAEAPTAAPPAQANAGKITILQRQEYFEGVEIKFRNTTTQYIASRGGELDISTVNPEVFGDFNAKIQASVQSGNPPDLAYHTNSVQQLYFLDTLEDVTDVVEELVGMYGAVVPVNAADNALIDGRWYSVPFISNSGAWFARRDIFEAKGIDVSTLTTDDQRRDAALAVSDPAAEMWGWGLTVNKSGDGHGLITGVIQRFGGSFTDESGTKVVFNSPQTVEAVKWLAEIYMADMYKPMLPPGVESWTDPSNNEAFLAGKVALTTNAFSVYAKAKQDQNPIFDSIAVLRAPVARDGNVLEAGGNGWFSIFKGAKNPELAKETILHLLKPENFLPMAQEGGGLFLPAYKNLWNEELLSIDPNFRTLQDIIFNPTNYTGNAYPAKPNAAIDAITAASLQSELMSNVITGRMSAEAAVQDTHEKIVKIFEELGLPQ